MLIHFSTPGILTPLKETVSNSDRTVQQSQEKTNVYNSNSGLPSAMHTSRT